MRRLITALCLAVGLTVGLAAAGASPAAAQGCYSAGEARAAVQSGQVVSLSSVIGQIKATTGGEVLSSPRLCNVGGRLVYFLNVLIAGQVHQVQVDGPSGSISY